MTPMVWNSLLHRPNTLPVRTTLAGLLFGLAYACASLTISGFLLQRTAFDPDNSADAAGVVLDDSALKTELVNFIVDNTAVPGSPTDPKQIEATIRHNVGGRAPRGREVPRRHHPRCPRPPHRRSGRAGGDHRGRPRADRAQREGRRHADDRPARAHGDGPGHRQPRARLAGTDRRDRSPSCCLLLGITAHPERDTALFWLAYGLILLGLVVAILGYLVPKFVVPAWSATACGPTSRPSWPTTRCRC